MLGDLVGRSFSQDVLPVLIHLTFLNLRQHQTHRALRAGRSKGRLGPGWNVSATIRKIGYWELYCRLACFWLGLPANQRRSRSLFCSSFPQMANIRLIIRELHRFLR